MGHLKGIASISRRIRNKDGRKALALAILYPKSGARTMGHSWAVVRSIDDARDELARLGIVTREAERASR
jgi:hypothetical protein